jgi:GntR family transcriptional regulator, sialic acid-inducible nan operon repressor
MVEPLNIERRKLFEHVASHLEEQIVSGKLKPGEQLPPERDLQERFGVGRPAIREALITLQRAGLVETGNGARARVSTPTASNIFNGVTPAIRQMLADDDGQRAFQDARAFFEAGLARNAARTASSAEVFELGEALAANKLAIGDREAFIRTDIAFHFVLAKIARNPVFLALHDQISGWLKEQRVVTLNVRGQDETAYEAHQRIYEAVRDKNADGAEQAMIEHLSQLTNAFWKQRAELETEAVSGLRSEPLGS